MRILFVTSLSPFPSVTGGTQRTCLLWEALSKLGSVDMVLHAEWPHGADNLGALERAYGLKQYHLSPEAVGTAYYPVSYFSTQRAHRWSRLYSSRRSFYAERARVAAQIRALHRSHRYDLVVSRYFRCACRSGLFGLTPLCVDVDDVDWEIFASHARLPGLNWLKRRIFLRQQRHARAIMDRRMGEAELAWVTKEGDRAKINCRSVAVLPNGVCSPHPAAKQPSVGRSKQMLFVGTFEWQPNRDGVWRFATCILPLIRERHPEARLRVVGTGGPQEFRAAMAQIPGVDFIGYAEDLKAHYNAVLFAVIPVYFGGGSHVKILENFHFGVTCVVSAFGHRGYEGTLPSDSTLLTAEDDQRFAEACVALIENPSLRLRLAAAGMAVVRNEFSKEAFQRRVASSIEAFGMDRRAAAVEGRA